MKINWLFKIPVQHSRPRLFVYAASNHANVALIDLYNLDKIRFVILSLAPTSHNNLMCSESGDGAYRERLLKVSRLLSGKDCAELTLRYELNAELFTEPAAVIRALEQRDILSKSRPESMLNVLTELKNEEALTLWKTFIDERDAIAVEDISERGEYYNVVFFF